MRKRRFISLLAAAALLMGLTATGAAAADEANPYGVSQAFLDTQFEANMQYNRLLEHFTVDGEIQYPIYYAGGYLNEDGYLVVMVTDAATESDIQTLKQVAENDALIIQYHAQHAYSYLIGLQNQVISYCEAGAEEAVQDNIAGSSIYDDQNLLEVELRDASEPAVAQFIDEVYGPSVYSSGTLPVTFVQAEEPQEPEPAALQADVIPLAATDIYPGNTIQVARNDEKVETMTCGFLCTREIGSSRQLGYITAGHGVVSSRKTVYNGVGDVIGETRATVCGGKVDAAFFEVDRGITMHDTITTIDYDVSFTGKTTVAQHTICAYGRTSGLRTGQVIASSTNCSGYDANGRRVTIYDVLKVKYSGELGDSGGPVWLPYGSQSKGYIVGLHINFNGSNSFACKIDNIIRELDVVFSFPR